MPLFEYVCTSCGAESELLVRSADEKVVCISCGSRDMEKQLSTFAVNKGGSSSLCADGKCDLAPDAPCASGCCNLS